MIPLSKESEKLERRYIETVLDTRGWYRVVSFVSESLRLCYG